MEKHEAVPLTFTSDDRAAARTLINLALVEDLGTLGDLTSEALISADLQAIAQFVVRDDGILAGIDIAKLVFERIDPNVKWTTLVADGSGVLRGTAVAKIHGPLRSILSGERTALNFLTHLSGIATLTRRFVTAIGDAKAVLLDTRKTLPGWRRLEKYAVRAGGGTNHRMGLFDGCLIKDNHLAGWKSQSSHPSIAEAIAAARKALEARKVSIPIEVEVDSITQLKDALKGRPDIVLLDNMDLRTLQDAIKVRDAVDPHVLLEVSGGVTLATVAAIAATSVDRISVGALTHSAPALDIALDWGCTIPVTE
jgi:nicotinate-nucleotide pyrophosphorylase (carboxylating)